MPREKLQAALRELEAELHSLEEVDEETRRLLEEAAEEIDAALDEEQPDEAPSSGLLDRLRKAAVSFEASHPTMAGILNRIVDGLGQLGI